MATYQVVQQTCQSYDSITLPVWPASGISWVPFCTPDQQIPTVILLPHTRIVVNEVLILLLGQSKIFECHVMVLRLVKVLHILRLSCLPLVLLSHDNEVWQFGFGGQKWFRAKSWPTTLYLADSHSGADCGAKGLSLGYLN